MLPLRKKTKKLWRRHYFFNFFLKIGEFPKISWNSREFMGIPDTSGNSRGDSLNFGKNKKKKMLWHQKSGKKSCHGATVTYI